MIEVQHLTKRYGPFTAVDDVSFRVEKGEILGFLGPNGAGKTTTMRVLTGYMPATEGKAIVAGYDVFAQPLEAKRRTGYLPETPPLYPDMTVREYLTFVAQLKLGKTSQGRARPSGSTTAMKKTHVDDMANRHCGKLSKGYRQRVGLAQALIHDPEVLILDEPTAGLDPKQIIETRDLIRSLAGNHTIVLSTHILPEVAQTCQRVVIINKGRVVAVDTPENLTHQLKGAATLYVQVDGRPRRGRRARGRCPACSAVTVADQHGTLIGLRGRRRGRTATSAATWRARSSIAGGACWSCGPTRMSLEEIFLQLTTEEHAQTGGPAWVAPCATSPRSPARNCAAISARRSPGSCWACSPCVFGYFYNVYLQFFVRQAHADASSAQPQPIERQHRDDPAAAAATPACSCCSCCRWSRCGPTRRRSARARSNCC